MKIEKILEQKVVKFGTPQDCPLCKMSNPSGFVLPKMCIHCKGTGIVNFKNNKGFILKR